MLAKKSEVLPPGRNLSNSSEKLVRNTLFNIAGSFWSYLVFFLLTPYIISKIGIEGYGIWSLAFVLINYIVSFDLSVNSSFVKYIAEYYTKRDYRRINEVINTGGLFYLFFALIALGLFFPLKALVISLFKIPSPLLKDAIFVFSVLFYATLIAKIFEIFSAVLQGLQRMEMTNKLLIFLSFPRAAGIFLFLERGWGLKGLAINEMLIISFMSLASAVLAKGLLPEIKIGGRFVKFERFKELFRFGIKLFLSRLSTLANFQFDKALIPYFFGVGLVAFYDLGSKILFSARHLVLLLTTAVVPAAAELQAEGQMEWVYTLYRKSAKYVISFGLPLMLFAVVTAPEIMFGWMGEGYGRSVDILRILAIGYFFNTAAGSISPIVQGIGKPEVQMWTALLSFSLNIPLSLFLITRMGFLGAALGTTIAMAFAATSYFWRFHRLFKKSALSSFKDLFFLPSLSAATGSLLLYAFFSAFHPMVHQNRIVTLTFVILTLGLFLLAHILFLFKSGYLDRSDLEILGKVLPFAKHKRQEVFKRRVKELAKKYAVERRDEIRVFYADVDLINNYEQMRFSHPIWKHAHRKEITVANSILKRKRPKRVLDLALGTARATRYLRGFEVGIGTDISEEMLLKSRSTLDTVGNVKDRWYLVGSDAFQLPFAGRSFDVVVSFRFLRHFRGDDRVEIFQEVRRVLVPGGYFIFEALNSQMSEVAFQNAELDKYRIYDELWCEEELQKEVEETGFRLHSLFPILNHFQFLWFVNEGLIKLGLRPFSAFFLRFLDRFPSNNPYEWGVVCQKR